MVAPNDLGIRVEPFPPSHCPEALSQESKAVAKSSAKWDSAHGRNPYTNLSPLVGPPFPKV